MKDTPDTHSALFIDFKTASEYSAYMSGLHRILFLCALTGAFGGALDAAPIPCPATSLTTYLQSGFSCTEAYAPFAPGDVFTFKNFFFQGPPSSPNALTSNQISVLPLSVPGNSPTQSTLALDFWGPFNADSGQSLVYQLNYFVDPPPTIIVGAQTAIDPATLVTVFCATNTFPCLVPLATLTVTTANPFAQVTFPMALNMVGIQNRLTLDGTSGPVMAGGFKNSVLVDTARVPEPATLAFTAFGLLGVLAFRSRAKLRQVLFQLLP